MSLRYVDGCFFFFFNDTATTEIYTLSLHDALPIFIGEMLEQHGVTDLVLHGDRRPYHIVAAEEARARGIAVIATDLGYVRSEEHTSELQSPCNIVCRLLLEKNKTAADTVMDTRCYA